MSSKRMLIIVAASICFIALMVCVSFIVSNSSRSGIEVKLADVKSGEDGFDEYAAPAYESVQRVEITPDNVQTVIQTIDRPDTYNRMFSVESFWEGGSSTKTLDVFAVGENTAMLVSGGERDKNIIVAGGSLYIWYTGDSDYYKGPADAFGDAKRTSDEYQMLITYEDIIALPRDSILNAGYTEYGGELCVYVTYRSGDLDYITTCYISARLGLVTAAEIHDGDMMVYKMYSEQCVIGEQDMSIFTLPDGTSAVENTAH